MFFENLLFKPVANDLYALLPGTHSENTACLYALLQGTPLESTAWYIQAINRDIYLGLKKKVTNCYFKWQT